MIHDFSVCLRTGSNLADINRFRSQAGKKISKKCMGLWGTFDYVSFGPYMYRKKSFVMWTILCIYKKINSL